MKKKLVSLLSAAVLGCFGLPAWSQTPAPAVTPTPTPIASVENKVPPPEDAGEGLLFGKWSFGGGAYGLMPIYQSNPAFIFARTTGTGAGTSGFINQVDFNQRIQAAPLAWLGYTLDSGLGMRVRWFEFDSDSSITGAGNSLAAITSQYVILPSGQILLQNSNSPLIANAVISASENLSINVIDAEATNNFTWCHWAMLASAGVRYGTIDQSYNFEVSTPFRAYVPAVPAHGTTPAVPAVIGVPAATYTASSCNNFTGVGPTLGLEARRQISDSDLFFYSSARGSLLFGSSQEQGTVPFPPSASLSGHTYSITSNGTQYLSNGQASVLGIGELEIGAECEHSWGRLHFSAQLALVGQMWWGAGNSTQVQSLDATPTAITGVHSVPVGGNLGFVGGVGRIGVSF